ncbi:AbrB family transcriptional regulator [Acetobacteraceae bacterium H6797]|nr:AbrB family transcriptional regulator [Acetobacteraceae bacterium H6797]
MTGLGGRIGRLSLGYGLATAGGAACFSLGTPLPWMIGALLTIATARMLDLPVATSRWLRNMGLVVIGAALGLNGTPEVMAHVAGVMPVIIAAAIGSIVIGILLSRILARLGRVDPVTALFASFPGGVAEMAMMGEAYGGKPTPIALAQMLRVVVVVVAMPLALAAAGAQGHIQPLSARLPFEPLGFALLMVSGALVAMAMVRVGIRMGWVIGPIAVSLAFTLPGYPPSGVPNYLIAAAQVAAGATLGMGFERETMRRMRRFIPAALTHVVILVSCCAALGLSLAWLTGLPPAVMVLSTSPGGMPEMTLTAKALLLDVPLVTTFHLVRVYIVALTAPLIFKALRRRLERAPQPAE